MADRAAKSDREQRAPARKPTYGAAARLVRLLYGLLARPRGWGFAAIEAELGISDGTLLPYLAACRRELVDADGRPILQTFRRGESRMLRLVESGRMEAAGLTSIADAAQGRVEEGSTWQSRSRR